MTAGGGGTLRALNVKCTAWWSLLTGLAKDSTWANFSGRFVKIRSIVDPDEDELFEGRVTSSTTWVSSSELAIS